MARYKFKKKGEITEPRAIIYTRFSPRPDEEKSESCETQKALCEEYCRKRNYPVIGYHEDPIKSGNDEDRPGLWAAIDQLAPGVVLVAWRYDRLARSVYLQEIIFRAAKNAESRVEVVNGNVYSDKPEDVMLRQIVASFNEYDRKVTAARIRHAMIQHMKNGRKIGGTPPYGWQPDPNDDSKVIPHEKEQDAVDQIKVWHAEGVSCRRTSIWLNKDPDRWPCRGKRWTNVQIGRILARERKYGNL